MTEGPHRPGLIPRSLGRAQQASVGKAISLTDVGKSFRLPHHRPSTLKERVLHPLRRNETTELQALMEVSLEVGDGEFFGIIGRNGSGKSTLLKLIAGIYRPDAGEVRVAGRVSPFIELGVGFNGELTAKDNIVINATLLGLSRAEALGRFDQIIEYAELERFTELKLKNYSSGMQTRLAFATAIQVDADVLLLDEVLAVGDASFQAKCFETFRELKAEGRTIVLVTHALESIRRFCDRALLLEGGEVVMVGDPDRVADRYQELAAAGAQVGAAARELRSGDGAARVLDAWFEDETGRRTDRLDQGGTLRACARIRFDADMEMPVLGLVIRGETGQVVFATNTESAKFETGSYERGEETVFTATVPNHFAVGIWLLTVLVAHADGTRFAEVRHDCANVRVDGKRWSGGAVDLPHQLTVEDQGASG